ncbi:MAG: prepilin peptidase, partial [Candidatus Geothermincolia bacterium]
ATGLLFLGVFWHNGWEWRAELLPQLLLVTVLVVVSGIDLDEQIIPNRIVIPGLVAGLVAMGVVAGVRGDAWIAARSAIGAAIGAGLLGLIALAVPRGMGMGDAKLAGFIGAFLGPYVLAALMLAFLTGSVVGIALIGFGRRGRRDRIPFGPFLATGAVLALFWGEPLYRLYRSLFNLG